jgi:hypothetical protein
VICSSSIREPILVGIVIGASFAAHAEAPMCSVPGMLLPVAVSMPVTLPLPLVPMVANLPFTADVSGSILLPDGSEGDTFKQLYSIARNSGGRVSVKSRGYKAQNGGRMAFSMKICDPISGATTSFQACVDGANDASPSDGCTVKKVAQAWAGPNRLPDSGLPVFPDPFKPLPAHHASAFVPRSGELVDLREKDLEGVRVHGYRNVGVYPNTCDGMPVSAAKEWWVSEKAALEVSVTTRRSAKGELEESPTSLPEKCLGGMTIELTNIQQVEPEPELFQVPPDYKIVQKPTIKPQSLASSPKPGDPQTQ